MMPAKDKRGAMLAALRGMSKPIGKPKSESYDEPDDDDMGMEHGGPAHVVQIVIAIPKRDKKNEKRE